MLPTVSKAINIKHMGQLQVRPTALWPNHGSKLYWQTEPNIQNVEQWWSADCI